MRLPAWCHKSLNPFLKPVDLARATGLSAQAIRNYEAEGVLPPSCRLASGHRRYTPAHLDALRAFLALTRAAGRPQAVAIMRPLIDRDLDAALSQLDRVHAQLLADRHLVESLAAQLEDIARHDQPAPNEPLSPIELARRIGVTTTTLRAWEKAGILDPRRASGNGQRHYLDNDVRDAELTHLLRRAGHGLSDIAATIKAVHAHGGAPELASAVASWREQLQNRARELLSAAGNLSSYALQLEAVDEAHASNGHGSINVPGQYS